MITEKISMKTELTYSNDKTKRYCLSIEWDKQKKKAVVIMLCASSANGIALDNSTNLVLSNLATLGYGAVKIVNLFATVCDGKSVIEKDMDEDNLKHIIKAVQSSDTIIYAVGTGHITNKSFRKCQQELLKQLSNYEDILMCISDVSGKKFYHPLCPIVRIWNLVPFKVSELLAMNNKELYGGKL